MKLGIRLLVLTALAVSPAAGSAGEVVLYAAPVQTKTKSTPPILMAGIKPVATSAPLSRHPHPLFGTAPELSVETLVQQVLARNPTLAQMTAAWQAVSARIAQVSSLDDPMFLGMVAPASFGSNTVDAGYRIEISQKIPFPGKLPLRGASAQFEARAAGKDVENMRLQLAESSRNAFYDYYLVGRALAVNKEALRLLRDFQETARTRYASRLVPFQDVAQGEVEIGRQQEREITLQRMRQVAIARVNTLLHMPPDLPLPPPPNRLSRRQMQQGVEVLRSLAQAGRPDLQALAHRVAADQAALALACREYFPDFEAVAAYDTMMGNGPLRDLAPQVGIRLNLPVRCARRAAAVAEAQARLAQRRAELAARIDQVNFQVQEAYEQVRESDRIAHLYETQILPAARQQVEAARSAYQTGAVPFLTLIEAQRNRVNLLDRWYESAADAERRRATLERVVGGPLAR